MCVCLQTACNKHTQPRLARPIKPMKWLIGEWENKSDKGDLYEKWWRINDTVLGGFTFMLAGSDTLFQEKIEIQCLHDTLFYVTAVNNQNDGNQVRFKRIQSTPTAEIFENKLHDFPQRIIYQHPHVDTLTVRIEGEIEGRLIGEDFVMWRKR